MDEMREGLEFAKRSRSRMDVVVSTQQLGIKEAKRILGDILQVGMACTDVEYAEELSCDVEMLTGYCIPGVIKNFRHLFSLLYYIDVPEKYPDILAHINYMLVVLDQAEKYLKLRAEGMNIDVTSLIEAHLGYPWENIDFLENKMYEEDAELLQVSFYSIREHERETFMDKGYWFDLKSRKIHYTSKIRPKRAIRYIKGCDTEYDVLQPKILFIYPGRINCRIRWKETQRRAITSKDMAVLLESAETDYTDAVNRMKESFREPLANPAPALLIKLHKAFIHGDHLVLEDEHGGLLTVRDSSDDGAPTSELLRAVLPAQSVGCALLVEVNEDYRPVLFSVKPLSVITPDRIIRLLY